MTLGKQNGLSLNIPFLTYKMGIVIVPTSYSWEVKEKCLTEYLVVSTQQVLGSCYCKWCYHYYDDGLQAEKVRVNSGLCSLPHFCNTLSQLSFICHTADWAWIFHYQNPADNILIYHYVKTLMARKKWQWTFPKLSYLFIQFTTECSQMLALIYVFLLNYAT